MKNLDEEIELEVTIEFLNKLIEELEIRADDCESPIYTKDAEALSKVIEIIKEYRG